MLRYEKLHWILKKIILLHYKNYFATCYLSTCRAEDLETNSPGIGFFEEIEHELHTYDIHGQRKHGGKLKQKKEPSYKCHNVCSWKVIKKNLKID